MMFDFCLGAMATKDYGANTGNTASTYHEVRTWKEEYQPKGKPLIPLRMVRACALLLSLMCRVTRIEPVFADSMGRRI